ncbi:MAG: hypothetical protein COT92_03600 [Candidatus Doudnabacteria bacterium CG10_big_fil_rev_8_21_14_0_10_42_18]|uniref:Uncharacterized protein n=1 Tax=Candidatus Doudnabacteria bacterium CG10_big_fil_rev_8_21_14_0_10_42_18 TaxID=1974552 RepID=A0A2H0VA62_9BACT|nr:MAG: hypothetical protein COT92_03600 [Candidatus Doudnabacteria bacterium CG10_big_fil_rev_8_21_14_0_10_42_18]
MLQSFLIGKKCFRKLERGESPGATTRKKPEPVLKNNFFLFLPFPRPVLRSFNQGWKEGVRANKRILDSRLKDGMTEKIFLRLLLITDK